MDAGLSVLVRYAHELDVPAYRLRDRRQLLAIGSPDVRCTRGVGFGGGGEACIVAAGHDQSVLAHVEDAAFLLVEPAGRQAERRALNGDVRSCHGGVAGYHERWRKSRG